MSKFLTIKQAAAQCNVCRNTMRAMMDRGEVRAVDLNPRGKRPTWRIVAASLEEFREATVGIRIMEEWVREAELARRLGL